MTIELALDLKAELGESPIWDARSGCLYFVDVLRGHVHHFLPADRSERTYEIDRSVGAVALGDDGDLVLAVADGFARLDPDSGAVRTLARVEHAADRRMNDGACDAAGRFWAGTMALDEHEGGGALYCLESGARVRQVLAPVSISNGIDWSADNRHMYYVDTPTGRVDVFDFDLSSGTIAGRRPFVQVAPASGAPDGLTVDAEEHVWVTLWGGGAVHRVAPDGSLDRVVPLPVTHPTSCAFGGEDLGDLYITTATIALDAAARAQQPHAGGLFRCRPGVMGRPAHRFRG
jgi:sugar lactone lactonase YvrE